MSLYFENAIHFKESDTITTNCIWHPTNTLLATASYSQDRGGFISIFDEIGEPISDANPPNHSVSQVTSLIWHPEKLVLISGWEDGALRLWVNSVAGFTTLADTPHVSSVMVLLFSEKGSRLVSTDSSGNLVCWKFDTTNNQLLSVFHHDLKEPVTHLTFRLTINKTKNNQSIDEKKNLAAAAVSGDETAINMLSNWRPKTAAFRSGRVTDGLKITEQLAFFVGTQTGMVYYVTSAGVCIEVLNMEGHSLMAMLHHPSKDSLIIMSEGLTIGHYSIDSSSGDLSEILRIKLSGKSQAFRGSNSQGICWATDKLLLILTGDMNVRAWDIESNDSYTLPITDSDEKNIQFDNTNSIFTCLSFCKLKSILCAGTNLGYIYFWSFRANISKQTNIIKILKNETYIPLERQISENGENQWKITHINQIKGTVKQLSWGNINQLVPLLSVNCITKVFILKEQNLNAFYFDNQIWAIQTSANDLKLFTHNDCSISLKSDIQVQSMGLDLDHCTVSNGKVINVYDLIWDKENKLTDYKLLSSFQFDNETILIFKQKIIALTQLGVHIRSLTGIPINNLTINQNEGEPIGINLNNNYLTIYTLNGFVKLLDLNISDSKKMIQLNINMATHLNDFGEIILAKSNSNGTKIAFTMANINLMPDQKIYFYDVESNQMQMMNSFIVDNFSSFSKEKLLEKEENLSDDLLRNMSICSNRIPIDFYWDAYDDRLFICCAKKLLIQNQSTSDYKINKSEIALANSEQILVTMFITSENHKVILKEMNKLEKSDRLVTLNTPYIVILVNNNSINRNLMTDFNDIENINDPKTRQALLNFSYYLSLDNIDTAIKSLKQLPNSTNAWRNLARVCVKTKRIDVARICLGHMGAAREARAIRIACEDPTLEKDAVVALLAVHLGLLDEAERLYKSCGRYDLLNKLYQAQNKFDKASEIAQNFDRINLRETAYHHAKTLEFTGDIKQAIEKYEKSGCQRENVPRLLLDKPKELEEYIKKSNDKELYKWWGQFLESNGEMEQALKAYELAEDYFSQVRVLLFAKQEIDKAAEIARKSNDKAAAYHMGRYYESNDDIKNAVTFFIKAHAFKNAIRLCREHNLSNEMWQIAPLASQRDQMLCAKYFESLGDFEKAILLYHQSGMIHKAIDLAFKSKKYDALQQISKDLDRNSDPVLVQKCAQYFIENGHFEKAVDLLAVAKQYLEALRICQEHNVHLTDELTEKLTPLDKKDDDASLDTETRQNILKKMGEILQIQGQYHLATKKFTQAGDQIRAMKSLLKSGDTEKIIFFANVSRVRDCYIMAANYLQSLDWQNNENILKNIVLFYTKGKAMDLLANFYVACAQIEIDEFQNYEKALGALSEASRAINKVNTSTSRESSSSAAVAISSSAAHRRVVEIINSQMLAIKRFVEMRRQFERGDFDSGIAQAQAMLNTNDQNIDKYIRKGDIYATIIQYGLNMKKLGEARKYLNELREYLSESSNNYNLTYFLNEDIMQDIEKQLNIPMSTLIPQRQVLHDSFNDQEQEIQEQL